MVESMRAGSSPTDATRDALSRIAKYYPGFQGALIAVNINGQYGKLGFLAIDFILSGRE